MDERESKIKVRGSTKNGHGTDISCRQQHLFIEQLQCVRSGIAGSWKLKSMGVSFKYYHGCFAARCSKVLELHQQARCSKICVRHLWWVPLLF